MEFARITSPGPPIRDADLGVSGGEVVVKSFVALGGARCDVCGVEGRSVAGVEVDGGVFLSATWVMGSRA